MHRFSVKNQKSSVVFELQWTDLCLWQHEYMNERSRPLSEIAMRLVSVGTSESDIERLVSVHRFICRDRLTNLGAEVVLARLRMRTWEITRPLE